jgi:site-specific DNA recombinase
MPGTAPSHANTGDSGFAVWLIQPPVRGRLRGRPRQTRAAAVVRFAFYSRTSTGRFQDPASSQEWQRDKAQHLVAQHLPGRGRIAAEYFDVGHSRTLPWQHRPKAAALLQAAADPDRGFDAVVIGEFERSFTADQARSLIAQLHVYHVDVWLPEFGGPVDLTDPTHQALLQMLGHQAEREVLRARRRTTRAMAAQVRTQGPHLGGRPPYGYRHVDAGPHPNVQHASEDGACSVSILTRTPRLTFAGPSRSVGPARVSLGSTAPSRPWVYRHSVIPST